MLEHVGFIYYFQQDSSPNHENMDIRFICHLVTSKTTGGSPVPHLIATGPAQCCTAQLIGEVGVGYLDMTNSPLAEAQN